jgi:membrane-associated PAP2 superfamily phosphatase
MFTSTIRDDPERARFAIWTPLVFLFVSTVLIWLTGFDLKLAAHYYDATQGWHLGQTSAWYYTNRYGEGPGFYTGMLGLIVLILGLRFRWFHRWRRASAYLFLLLALGPGLVVNGIFKELYGRPRPVAVEQFGGPYPFLHVWEPGFGLEDHPEHARKAFPSGHAANGFYFVAIYFLFRRQRRALPLPACGSA